MFCGASYLARPTRTNKINILSVPPPEIRSGMIEPNPKGLKLLACASSVYHAVKLHYLEVALLARFDSNLLPLVQLIFKLADSHSSDMHSFGRT